ncbi:MAG: cache domain-containing protein [Bacteroidales bacterium]|nr:cache domain-containing protein [Bacteroidales bacterium]
MNGNGFKKGLVVSAIILLAASIISLLAAFGLRSSTNTDSTARRVERTVGRRLAVLESFTRKALDSNPREWLEIGELPSDMTIYRYVNDSLSSWVNRFSTSNDELLSGMRFQNIGGTRASMRSPLSKIGEDLTFCNIGPKWYLARTIIRDNVRFIVGLEVMNTLDERSFTGINPRLRVPDNYSIHELSSSGGSEVSIDGRPQFKISYDSLNASSSANMPLLWAALLLFLAAGMVFLRAAPGLRGLATVLPLSLLSLLLFYIYGGALSANSGLFSPLLYADGRVFYSLGALILLSLMIAVPVLGLFIKRKEIRLDGAWRPLVWIWAISLLLICAGVVLFSFVAIRSVLLNSNICLEIYKINELSGASLAVYLLLVVLLSCVAMLLQMLRDAAGTLFGLRRDSFPLSFRIGFSVAAAAFLVVCTAVFGFQREQDKLEVWANRLAVTRDIGLEMQLRSVENQIASDPMIATLSAVPNGASLIRNRIVDTYLPRVAQEYDFLVTVGDLIDLSLLRGGEYISSGTRFIYKEEKDGLAAYYALFGYNLPDYGTTSVLLQIEQKGDWRYRGYTSILGGGSPGEVLIPSSYSFARYQGRNIITLRGSYAYPVKMDDRLAENVYEKGVRHMNSGGYTHFVYVVAEDESVIVSRRTISAFYYAGSAVFIALVLFIVLSLLGGVRRRETVFDKNYFSTRLRWVVMISLTLALVSMAAVSVFFVYERNEQNRRTLMTEKINSIAASISTRIRGATTPADLRNNDVLRLIEDVGNNTNSDVTLYDRNGMVMMSTAPNVFDRMLVDSRIDGKAYHNVMQLTSRYYIQKEKVGRHSFYSMYSPLVGDSGNIIAIICAPYTDDTYEFETTAANHAITVLSVFIFLLLISSFMARRVLDRMFKPLVEIGRKMEDADLGSLEYIEYDKQDEITSLVNAYNRMVTDLSESSRQLAEAERDKAWSGMARQVAHEIKNPLTPMKLQIQRLVRLKDKGDPAWQEKFDEVSKVLLDHIDILTDTANEFSTFARLYTEEPTEINLDVTLQEEIAMFSGREDVRFDYIGLENAVVTGPKPQLTRVFVNLINNAVQALDGVQDGRVMVSLRNSVKEGYYDIVFEDNGPGVAPENVDRLFTPNFTTKTGGSGLGLAISRSILQKCSATISYSKSFSLGGACFTILYPKNV